MFSGTRNTLIAAALVTALLSGCAATGDVSLDANGSSGTYAARDDILQLMETDSAHGGE